MICTIRIACVGVLLVAASAWASAADTTAGWGDFSLDLSKSLSPGNHLFVGSGWSTVHPVPETVMGVGAFFAPPYACPDFSMSVAIAADGCGAPVPDKYNLGKGDVGLLYAGGVWKPDRIIRRGTYHQTREDRVLSLGVTSELVPLYHRGGFLLKVTLVNRTDRPLSLSLTPTVAPGEPNYVPLGNWAYPVPTVGPEAATVSDGVWSNGKVRLSLFTESCQLSLPPGEAGVAWLALVASDDGQPPQKPEHLADWETETAQAWSLRLAWALKNLPVMETNVPGLLDYYRRSIASGLVCIWENPAFAVNPHVASLGLDGGGLCTYLWDSGGYTSEIQALMLGQQCKPILDRMVAIDLSRFYAFSLDGSGVGCSYSYSPFALTSFVWAVCCHQEPDRKVFEAARRLVLDAESHYPSRNGLLDYGVQRNLLEMRGLGYEHFVPSPNAERAWCLERLADLGESLDEPDDQIQAWRTKAAEIRAAVKRELWDPARKWFKCVYPDGRVEYVYSIQMFDVLQAIPDDADIRAGLLAQLRPGAFLADCGVESVSPEDAVHFEVIDTDWSGGGSYIGDGAALAQLLYGIGEADRAWDILQRYFWMGKHLPYYPQETLVDRPAVPAHKRANCSAGMAHAQAILYGLAGFDPRSDGSIWVNPHPPKDGRIALRGYRVHGRAIDVEFADGDCRIACDGVEVYQGPPRPLRIAPVK